MMRTPTQKDLKIYSNSHMDALLCQSWPPSRDDDKVIVRLHVPKGVLQYSEIHTCNPGSVRDGGPSSTGWREGVDPRDSTLSPLQILRVEDELKLGPLEF